ncbi:MAG: hypothetical protein RLZZ221_2800, partial [Verrucomicrobiota bacterium]
MSVASAALICAAVPASVSVALLLAPALIVAPVVPRVTAKVPFVTVRRVVARFPSTSATLIAAAPLNASAVSSATVCDPGTVFTGASFTDVTVIATVSVSVA